MKEKNQTQCGNMVGMAIAYKDAAVLLRVADQFTTQLARSPGVKNPQGISLEFHRAIFSQILQYSLNIEILLKSIILADEDKKVRGHKWTELFNKLSTERQTTIIEQMPEQFKGDFPKLLASNEDTFVKWRYSYEKQELKCDFSFVENLSNVLTAIAMKMVN